MVYWAPPTGKHWAKSMATTVMWSTFRDKDRFYWWPNIRCALPIHHHHKIWCNPALWMQWVRSAPTRLLSIHSAIHWTFRTLRPCQSQTHCWTVWSTLGRWPTLRCDHLVLCRNAKSCAKSNRHFWCHWIWCKQPMAIWTLSPAAEATIHSPISNLMFTKWFALLTFLFSGRLHIFIVLINLFFVCALDET